MNRQKRPAPRGEGRKPAGARRSGEAGGSRAYEAGLPVKKNEDYEADIIGLGHDGEGVGRVNGFTLFIHGALPGERVRVKVVKLKKQYGYGKLLEVLEASPDRSAPPCPIYSQCGGCQLQHLSYEAQLKWKRQSVIDSLERIGKLVVCCSGRGADVLVGEADLVGGSEDAEAGGEEDRAGKTAGKTDGEAAGPRAREHSVSVEVTGAGVNGDPSERGIVVHPTIGMDEPWRYRNKAQVPFGWAEGGLVGGFYAQGSHRIVDMDSCLIQHEANDDVVRKVKEIGRKLGITAYDEASHEGLLRHVVVKFGFRTGDVMVVLVTNGNKVPHLDEWVREIREAVPGVKSICHNVNTKRTNVIFGDSTTVLWGDEFIYDYIGDVKFAISARSFYQVNPVQTEVLYRTALDYAALTGSENVIDAYCGIGTISLFLARHAKQVRGVEIVAEAIADARRNAALNGIANVDFAVGKAEEVIPAWRAEEGLAPDIIVVDPPRKGCDPALLETIIEMQPRRVVYVSCNPATLARDLRVLEDGGYRTVEVQPVDMFPHTVHVESVALLVRDGVES
ncbi:23S rRNA (uracil(1939)-C(5))-methyltransferase RlmD [Paenibacillus aurantius]|uniref:23S rRNA (Uracil(1939)-C(5))-methyltransferase RlmD n=1 Tax=Paenibacillus aurantius TaxID=2918900 RepID=A0AA96LFQ1_9BACL|nr:23S rRNA (uracil(1939)-C(5))-methyltransferase RlmD [Paenibacillus aurantius]WNQ12198.1 23S rRNA (uracil(1939)-C(5))-methyltransferase RlmD [Paenibacillus aurantius]